MKHLSLIAFGLVASLGMTSMATAKISNPTTYTRNVNYQCLSGKNVKVRYGFNKQGLPTYASAVIAGKTRYMPRNLERSDNVDTFFGSSKAYTLATDYMDSKNYRKNAINITSPSQEMVFKNCTPR